MDPYSQSAATAFFTLMHPRAQPMKWGCPHSDGIFPPQVTIKAIPTDTSTGLLVLGTLPVENTSSDNPKLTFKAKEHRNKLPKEDKQEGVLPADPQLARSLTLPRGT